MTDYYSEHLSAERLRLCYEIAPVRIRQYLRSEIEYVLDRANASRRVLELGCGYGRVLEALVGKARTVVGIDISLDSLLLAHENPALTGRCHLARMGALELAFADRHFDMVVCIQNGISAFQVDKRALVEEARVAAPGTGVARATRLDGAALRDTLHVPNTPSGYPPPRCASRSR